MSFMSKGRLMQENYHSGNIIFSLFDLRGQRDEKKCIQLIVEQFQLSHDTIATDSKIDWHY